MHRKYNKFLIVSLIVIILLGFYSYFYNNLKSEASTSDGGLVSSKTGTTSTIVSSNAQKDTMFLSTLLSLKKIKIDNVIFTDKAFNLLVDNKIKIDPVPYGRTNPFSSLGKDFVDSNSGVYIKTNQATSITTTSSVLNGSIEGANSNNIYFEYGTTDKLGKITTKVTASLAGTFSSNLMGLTPKTTYFFRSVANINGVVTFGEIISFKTN